MLTLNQSNDHQGVLSAPVHICLHKEHMRPPDGEVSYSHTSLSVTLSACANPACAGRFASSRARQQCNHRLCQRFPFALHQRRQLRATVCGHLQANLLFFF